MRFWFNGLPRRAREHANDAVVSLGVVVEGEEVVPQLVHLAA